MLRDFDLVFARLDLSIPAHAGSVTAHTLLVAKALVFQSPRTRGVLRCGVVEAVEHIALSIPAHAGSVTRVGQLTQLIRCHFQSPRTRGVLRTLWGADVLAELLSIPAHAGSVTVAAARCLTSGFSLSIPAHAGSVTAKGLIVLK